MIRHGETYDNLSRKYSGKDTRLTDKGIEEIEETKRLIKKFTYDTAYVSPLLRAKETQEILGIEAIEDERIKEIDFGKFVGHDFNGLGKTYKEERDYWIEDYIHNRPLGGESIVDLYKRVVGFVEEKVLEDRDILLICHDGVIKSILGWVFDRYDYFFKFKLDNGSISVVRIEEGFKFIERLNYI